MLKVVWKSWGGAFTFYPFPLYPPSVYHPTPPELGRGAEPPLTLSPAVTSSLVLSNLLQHGNLTEYAVTVKVRVLYCTCLFIRDHDSNRFTRPGSVITIASKGGPKWSKTEMVIPPPNCSVTKWFTEIRYGIFTCAQKMTRWQAQSSARHGNETIRRNNNRAIVKIGYVRTDAAGAVLSLEGTA